MHCPFGPLLSTQLLHLWQKRQVPSLARWVARCSVPALKAKQGGAWPGSTHEDHGARAGPATGEGGARHTGARATAPRQERAA